MSLNPFGNRPRLAELFDPLVGSSMLELGGKQDNGNVYKRYFESLGFRHVSVDIAKQEVEEWGALPLDLTQPLNLGTFDVVTNIGTSEHVSEDNWDGQVACWRNIVEACHVGSVLICDTPAPGGWKDHGTWYPTREFYGALAAMNGFVMNRLIEQEWRPGHSRKVISARMTRAQNRSFVMPPRGLMFENQRQ